MSSLNPKSSTEYKSAMDNYNRLNQQYEALAQKYTGNAGYQNALNQATKGAGVVAQNQAAQTQNAARNAGMNRSQAAAMGANSINGSYANNFTNQQNMAMTSGMNNLNAQGQLAGNVLQGAGMEQAEKQNVYNRGNQTLGTSLQGAGTLLTAGGNILPGVNELIKLRQASDERCKVAEKTPVDISKCLSDIDTYIFKYKNKAQKEMPEMTDDKTHIGVMAQELEQNPVLKDVVEETEDGTKTVDIKSLTMENTALLADIAKRLERLEQIFPLGE